MNGVSRSRDIGVDLWRSFDFDVLGQGEHVDCKSEDVSGLSEKRNAESLQGAA